MSSALGCRELGVYARTEEYRNAQERGAWEQRKCKVCMDRDSCLIGPCLTLSFLTVGSTVVACTQRSTVEKLPQLGRGQDRAAWREQRGWDPETFVPSEACWPLG